ncbi:MULTISPECIES: diaminopimelate epimerase [Bacillus]|uniref:diaminopimelate epimerase n=1 Tax=Bacillus TaxID=1386 RepID=UPI0003102212|nr:MULTISPECIES: diaminopimelate epimerase [Bacillus]
MELKFIKCHGSGNDFLILDEYSNPIPLTDDERAKLTVTLCNREQGVGADGILFFQKSEIADGKMRVFNADGSEASMCGNGLRCIARYASELLNKKQLQIETMKAVLAVEKTEEIYTNIPTYKVEISPVSFQVSDLPMNIDEDTFMNQHVLLLSANLTFTAVAVPNPHLISIVDQHIMQSNVQEEISTYVNSENPIFPDGVNVSFVNLIQEGSIFVRTFERGVGFTNACGTAMSASTLVTCIQNKNAFNQEITVYNPGGKVKCIAHNNNDHYSIDLIGNATFEYEIVLEITNEASFQIISKVDFPTEVAAYKQMQEDVHAFLAEHLH